MVLDNGGSAIARSNGVASLSAGGKSPIACIESSRHGTNQQNRVCMSNHGALLGVQDSLNQDHFNVLLHRGNGPIQESDIRIQTNLKWSNGMGKMLRLCRYLNLDIELVSIVFEYSGDASSIQFSD